MSHKTAPLRAPVLCVRLALSMSIVSFMWGCPCCRYVNTKESEQHNGQVILQYFPCTDQAVQNTLQIFVCLITGVKTFKNIKYNNRNLNFILNIFEENLKKTCFYLKRV